MMLYEIKAAVAAYFERDISALTSNDGVDLGLVALNQVRTNAELVHDFEFSRNLVTISVDGVTGGSLDEAVEYGTSTPVAVKSVIDVGIFDSDGNLIPTDWETTSESLKGQRGDNPRTIVPRIPTDGQALSGPFGVRRFVFSANKVYFFPKTPNTTFLLGIEAYTFTPDWVDADLSKTSTYTSPWITRGHEYLQWGALIHLNHLFKQFVFRQEGNLPPPEKIRDNALESLKVWDIFRYEQFGRHA